MAPDDPSLIAFARQTVDAKSIVLRLPSGTELDLDIDDGQQVPSAEESVFGGLFETMEGVNQRRYDSSFRWRPVVDPEGVRWFAFVSITKETGSKQAYVNGLSAEDALILPRAIPLPAPGPVSELDWSADGSRLVATMGVRSAAGQPTVELFVSNPFDIDHLTVTGGFLEWHRITNNDQYESSPEWNKGDKWNKDYLVYRAENRADGERAIYVLLDVGNMVSADISPVKISGELDGYALYKPSWSPSGRYVSAYVSARRLVETTEDSQLQDIVLFDVLTRVDRDGRREIAGGRLLKNALNADRVVKNVVPSEGSGPAWIPSEDGLAIVYVDRTPGFPVKIANVSAFLANELDESRLATLAAFEQASQSKEVAVAMGSGRLHFAFSSQVEGIPTLTLRQIPLPGARLQYYQELDPMTAVKQSLMFPGRGQSYKGEDNKAEIFKYTGYALAAANGLLLARYTYDWAKCERASSCSGGIRSQRNASRSQLTIMFGMTTAFYAYNVYDAYSGFPIFRRMTGGELAGRNRKMDVKMAFLPGPGANPTAHLSIRF
ncbi:MAG: hypothetical protein RIE53_02650 [Rhodothermales bacterium]